MPDTQAPLAGKRILVTRAALTAGELVREIQRYGGIPVVFPTIEIGPATSWGECDRSIDQIGSYDGLIFTSANGVRYFAERLSSRGVPAGELRSKLICVVGEKTRQAAVEAGFGVTLMPERFTGPDLARAMSREDLAGRRFLFPRGNLGDDALPHRLGLLGALVDCVVVYETSQAQPENFQPVRTLLLEGGIHILTFTSPSTFINFVSIFSDEELMVLRSGIVIAAIGPATAAAINRYGINVDITPSEPSIESLVKSIIGFYHPASGPQTPAGTPTSPRSVRHGG
jgi:uroporphyrinogen III methyltransferase/synthase